MLRNIFALVLCYLGCAVLSVQAQQQEQKSSSLVFRQADKTLYLDFCTADMFRVRLLKTGDTLEAPEHLMVSTYQWDPVSVQRREDAQQYQLETDRLLLKVNKKTLELAVSDRNGKILSADQGELKWKESGFSISKSMREGEHFFGFGERMDFLDRRGKQLSLNVGRGKGKPHEVGAYNILEANYAPVPFFMSTAGYGIFLHNSFQTLWDMGLSSPDSYAFGASDGSVDYYFIYGPSFPHILDRYTDLTGKSPLLPEFALGLHAGTYSGGTWGHEELTSDAYVIALAKKFRELGIPVDLLWLDSTWRIFGKEGGNGATSFEWRDTFKDPKGMFDSLYALNYQQVGLHLRPRLDNGQQLDLLNQARKLGLVYPEPNGKGEFVNFFDQKSVDWWWEHGVKRVASQGARFLKTDEGSAFGGLANESDKTGPTDRMAQKLHNVFPITYAKAPYEKFQEFNGIRGLNHTREGYAGIQRYPFIFAGDWPSEWQYFEPVIKAGLNIGLSGVGSWGHCMGGFEHLADPELYMRWVQFGMFSPIAMVFGMEHPQYKEPWQYGEEALANFIKYDRLRYQLLPYIYSYSYQQYLTGMPLMRALVLAYQDDPNTYNISDQYLFGGDMMVCPVTMKGAKTRTVYLPEGIWYDYWTGEKYTGKQYVHLVTPPDQIPLFMKAGAIIPRQPVMSYVGEKKVDTLSLHIYPGGDGSFDLYEDDSKSLNYQKGQYALTHMAWKEEGQGANLSVKKQHKTFQVTPHAYAIEVQWTDRKIPDQIHTDKKVLVKRPDEAALMRDGGWYYDSISQRIKIQGDLSNAADFTLSIQ